MHPLQLFQHCPRCGVSLPEKGRTPLVCTACGLTYFFNPTVAAAVFVRGPDGRYLFIRRANEPAKGKLAVPGGFIDYGETAEEGGRRETFEEVGLHVGELRYVGSCLNDYFYKDVNYPVVDLVFVTSVEDVSLAKPLDGVASIEWQTLETMTAEELAFPSIVMGWQRLLSGFITLFDE